MTLVVTANVVGQVRGEPVRLPNRRRRLSTIVARHRPAGRQFIVSVHRKGAEAFKPTDRSVRLRATWKSTLVGPEDVVLITVVPLGKSFLSIGLAIASIALIAIAPYAAPAIAAGLTGVATASAGATFAVQAGLVIGGLALGYAAQAAKGAGKSQKQAELYSLSGGGNVPKPGSRRPLLYGRCWSAPPLSQGDYFLYDGDTMVLTKRMTLGIGKFQVHRIRVGDALFWSENGGLQLPFNSTATGNLGTAIEILYEQVSQLASGDVITSNAVSGQEMPRPGGNPDRTPWFRLTPQGVVADAALLSWTYPAVFRVSSSGRQVGTVAGVVFYGRKIDPTTGQVIGPEFEIQRSTELSDTLSPTPLRRSAYFRLPEAGSTYEISAQNAYPDPVGFEQQNRATWDGMSAYKDDYRIRPETTEIVLRIRAGKGLTVTAYSDIMVDATRIVPVWDGSAWTEQPTSKAVWAYCDLVRSTYGLAQPNSVDAAKALYYANLLADNDTYDGALPEVSSFWEAAGQLLLPLRADPVKVGAVHSFVRDESRAEPRHILTRRQIVRDSSGATYKTKVEGGDVIVEFDRDGDPKRPDEVRYSYGPPTRTPKRYKVAGITDGLHALKHATWLAAVAVFRGAERKIQTEWDGRLVYPGDHILSDLWFLRGKQAYGVASADGNVLTLDVTANVPAAYGYGSIRTRQGKEWGILRMRGVGARGLELHPEDVAALSAQTGLGLAAVLARDTQDPTTVVLGELVELRETYVARSAIPSDPDHVQVEMVKDDARVWQLLDEQTIAPAPVGTDPLAEPLMPTISVLHARCQRVETGIEVVWGVSVTLGARAYEVEISYDGGATWEVLSPLGPASSGRAQMRQTDQPVTVRARAYGRTGLHGDWITTTFTTVAPVVQGELIEPLSIQIEKMSAQLQKDIGAINDLGRGTLALGQQLTVDKLAEAQGLIDSAREATRLALSIGDDSILGSIRQLAAAVDRLAGEAATQTGDSFEERQLLKVADGRNFAAIERETRLRVSGDEVLASITTTLAVRLDTAEGGIVANASAIQGVSSRVTVAEGAITAQSQQITTLGARIDANDLAISGQATATQQLTARVTLTEGNIVSLSESLTALRSTVTTQGGQISANATAVDRVSTRAEQIDGRVTSEATRTTALEATVSDQGRQISGTSTALSDLTARTTTAEGRITSEAARLDALSSTVSTQGGQISSTADAVWRLTTRTSAAEGRIESEARRTDALAASVSDQGREIVGQARAIDDLAARTSTTEGNVTSIANKTTALEATASTLGGQISGNSQALQDLSARTSATEQGVSSQAQQLSNLSSTVSGQGGQIGANAQAVSQLQTRADNVDGQLSSQASSIQSLSTTQNGHTAQITTLAASYDGVKVQYGVTGYIDGKTGGFVLTGAKRLDGGNPFQLLVSADMFVDGLLTARMMSTTSLITTSAQIGNLTVDNINVKDGAISGLVSAQSNGQQASVTINVRTARAVAVLANRVGDLSSRFRQTGISTGAIKIYRDGNLIGAIPANFTMDFDPSPNVNASYLRLGPTTYPILDYPGVGAHTYQVVDDNTVGIGGVYISVQESK
ncbi:host specificity factor TipJ family phage tail protein [Methylobacterium aquaticum]|uniref:Methyl-accepting chemotaxis protein n=1 Tax=Methylobacterium aquaticum TaxID=270351 RepID=A0A0C6F7U2_9HYPH|nr:methyl-accepting chemotaxis protein [Methylobacterium aquaticum]BAQ44408.1 methyl-accepting chemotaxis protein [Methylobacterium aquaticum]